MFLPTAFVGDSAVKEMYNALPGMRCLKNTVCVLFATTLGCASGPTPRPTESKVAVEPKRGGWGQGHVGVEDDKMEMDVSLGYLDERAVDRAIKPHERSMIRCFDRAGEARKYLSGQLVMRFFISGSGAVSSVNVVKNALGNYSVERCLVGEASRIVFPPPEGRKGTDFEYSLSFQSTGERSVIPYSGMQMASSSPFLRTWRIVERCRPRMSTSSPMWNPAASWARSASSHRGPSIRWPRRAWPP